MSGAESRFGANSFRVLVTNDCNGHPAWKWAECTADQLVALDPAVTDVEKARSAVQFRHWIIEVLEPLFGLASRPSTDRVIELILQASQQTPWDIQVHALSEKMRGIIEVNLNTIYRSN